MSPYSWIDTFVCIKNELSKNKHRKNRQNPSLFLKATNNTDHHQKMMVPICSNFLFYLLFFRPHELYIVFVVSEGKKSRPHNKLTHCHLFKTIELNLKQMQWVLSGRRLASRCPLFICVIHIQNRKICIDKLWKKLLLKNECGLFDLLMISGLIVVAVVELKKNV